MRKKYFASNIFNKTSGMTEQTLTLWGDKSSTNRRFVSAFVTDILTSPFLCEAKNEEMYVMLGRDVKRSSDKSLICYRLVKLPAMLEARSNKIFDFVWILKIFCFLIFSKKVN